MLNFKKLGLTTLALGILASPTFAEVNTNINNSVSADQQTETATVANYDFGVYDQDNNDMVDETEFMAGIGTSVGTENMFTTYDADANGSLSEEEFEEFARKSGVEEVTEKTGGILTGAKNIATGTKNAVVGTTKAVGGAVVNTTKKAGNAVKNTISPSNEDVVETEAVILTMDFEVYDENNDDVVDAMEFEERTKSVSPKIEFSSFDTNSDGSLNIDEFQAYVDSEPRIEADVEDLIEDNS